MKKENDMAKVITKEDVQAAADKAATKATAAEKKRCIAAVKAFQAGMLKGVTDKVYARTAKTAFLSALAAIKAEAPAA